MAKKIKSVTVYRTDNLGQGLTGKESGLKGYKLSQTHYLENGQVVSETRFDVNGALQEKYENRFDDAGRLIEEITYLDDDEIAEHKTYERNENGEIVRSFKHYQDGDRDTIHFHRDDRGRLTEKITIDSDGEEEAREVFEYHEDRMTRHRVYEYDEPVLDESYVYDDKGNPTEHSIWTIEEEDATYRNEYDEKGRILTALKYDLKGRLVSKTEYRFEGDRLTGTVEETPYGTNTTTLVYDEMGNPAEQVEVDGNGQLNNKAVRKFNENGDVAESEVFINQHGRGINQHYILRYEYEYFG